MAVVNALGKAVPVAGLEPATCGLRKRCLRAWADRRDGEAQSRPLTGRHGPAPAPLRARCASPAGAPLYLALTSNGQALGATRQRHYVLEELSATTMIDTNSAPARIL